MSEVDHQETAAKSDAVADQPLPEVSDQLVSFESAGERERQQIEALMAEIDLRDTNSVIFFGAKAQQQLTGISDQMLDGVRNKDTGTAGKALNEMVATIRGFDVDGLDPNQKPGLLGRLFGKTRPMVEFLQRYEEVRRQIDGIGDSLERHKTQLLTDITSLDRLYTATLEYFHTLERYIAAGDEALHRADSDTIPELERQTLTGEEILKAQELRDLRAARDDLERRVHDLRLTRQVTMQALPSIRLVQENDKGLVTKISSTMANTIPLWRQQLAQAVTIYRSGEAAETLREATDLTNDLLQANAENLKTANRQVREQIERGVFDIEVVKQANRSLIETIEESLTIADEGKRRRLEATRQLETCEQDLRQALASASARSSRTGGPEGASDGASDGDGGD